MPETTSYCIGIDVGVTNIKCACVTPEGEVLAREATGTNADHVDWPSGVRGVLERIESERGRACAVGLAAPGVAAPDGSCITWMQGRFEAVQGLNWTEFLGRESKVAVLNDAQAALLGEVWIGAAKGCRNAMLLTLGTGVGGALMVDGRLLRGHLGRAGHLGHVCLDLEGPRDITNTPGSLEEAIGNCTVAARSAGRFASTHDLIAAHEAGDTRAMQLWLDSVQKLAAGIASLINVADPEMVIIGGGIARAGRSLFQPLDRWLEDYEWRPHGQRARIVPAELGEFAGAIGAAWNAMSSNSGQENAILPQMKTDGHR
jgi:glucokinase